MIPASLGRLESFEIRPVRFVVDGMEKAVDNGAEMLYIWCITGRSSALSNSNAYRPHSGIIDLRRGTFVPVSLQ
jgi:hypothetical protein